MPKFPKLFAALLVTFESRIIIFDNPTKFAGLYLAKFLNASAKSFFLCKDSREMLRTQEYYRKTPFVSTPSNTEDLHTKTAIRYTLSVLKIYSSCYVQIFSTAGSVYLNMI